MKVSITPDQFGNALKLLTVCAKRRWQHSTELIIADIVAKSENKDATIAELEKIVSETESETEAVTKFENLYAIL